MNRPKPNSKRRQAVSGWIDFRARLNPRHHNQITKTINRLGDVSRLNKPVNVWGRDSCSNNLSEMIMLMKRRIARAPFCTRLSKRKASTENARPYAASMTTPNIRPAGIKGVSSLFHTRVRYQGNIQHNSTTTMLKAAACSHQFRVVEVKGVSILGFERSSLMLRKECK